VESNIDTREIGKRLVIALDDGTELSGVISLLHPTDPDAVLFAPDSGGLVEVKLVADTA
jgi:hypothetical protein